MRDGQHRVASADGRFVPRRRTGSPLDRFGVFAEFERTLIRTRRRRREGIRFGKAGDGDGRRSRKLAAPPPPLPQMRPRTTPAAWSGQHPVTGHFCGAPVRECSDQASLEQVVEAVGAPCAGGRPARGTATGCDAGRWRDAVRCPALLPAESVPDLRGRRPVPPGVGATQHGPCADASDCFRRQLLLALLPHAHAAVLGCPALTLGIGAPSCQPRTRRPVVGCGRPSACSRGCAHHGRPRVIRCRRPLWRAMDVNRQG